MGNLTLKKEGSVFIVSMDDQVTANTFTADVLNEHMSVCAEISASTDNAAVVLTSSNPKFWSNGINLEWLLSQGGEYIPEFKNLIDKMLLAWATLPFPTIANITGHAFGGGAIMACCFDFRFMRADRGYFCFPEVDVNIPFTDLMHDIIGLLPDRQALWEAAFTGKRIGGADAQKMQIVNAALPENELAPKVMELATFLAQKNRATYASIKQGFKKKLYNKYA